MTSLNKKSKVVTQGDDRAPARSMLRAVGLTDEDMSKPMIGIANLASDVTPCNVHLDRIAQKAKMFPKGRVAAFPLIFGAGYLGLNTGCIKGANAENSPSVYLYL